MWALNRVFHVEVVVIASLEIISVLVLGGLRGQQEPKHLDLMVKGLTKSLFLSSVTRLCDFRLL